MHNKLGAEQAMCDEAARAAWLYYVGGRTQDEIAQTMGISRQRVQRLISRAMADGLIRVRIVHPIAALMELGQAVRTQYGLRTVRVAPDIGVDGNLASVAPIAARILEEALWNTHPITIGLGTGRALRASVDQLSPTDGSHHRLVSLVSTIAPDGSANFYDATIQLANLTQTPHYPLPIPNLAENPQENALYRGLSAYKKALHVASDARYIFVGIGQLDETAPVISDGFMSQAEWQESVALGAVGEIVGRAFNAAGEYIDSPFSRRLTSIAVKATPRTMVVGIAAGTHKIAALKAALKGKLINALVTDEPTAHALLAETNPHDDCHDKQGDKQGEW